MRRLLWFMCAVSLALGASWVAAQAPGVSAPITPGPYDVFPADNPNQLVSRFVVRPGGQHFAVVDANNAWSGEGDIYGTSGPFFWRFRDGKIGKSDFVVYNDGSWHGHSFGSGINFYFVAKPEMTAQALAPAPSGQNQESPKAEGESGVSEADADCAAEQAAELAARQALRQHVLTLEHSAQFIGADRQERMRLVHEATAAELAPSERQYAQCRGAHLPGLDGTVSRAWAAGAAADKAGNYQEAARQYKLVDASSNEVIAEVTPKLKDYNQNDRTLSLARRVEVIDAEGLLDKVAMAQRQLGVYEERGADYAGAAQYYQKAIDTMTLHGMRPAVEMIACTRLGFLYANGLGVPKDGAKARELLGHVWQDKEFISMLDHNVLPRTLDDVTPASLEKFRKEYPSELSDHDEMMLIALLLLSGGGQPTLRCTRSLGSNTYVCK
jgi:hypothetical protein